jgi:hypothetical protein
MESSRPDPQLRSSDGTTPSGVNQQPAGTDESSSANRTTGNAAHRAAVLRVLARCMRDLWAPRAKRALAECVLGTWYQPRSPDDQFAAAIGGGEGGGAPFAPSLMRIRVEAVGSGVVIAPALRVDRDATVAELKEELLRQVVVADSNDTAAAVLRLFAGHGGEELCDDERSLRAYAVAEGTTLVQLTTDERQVMAMTMSSAGLLNELRSGAAGAYEAVGPDSELLATTPLSAWLGVTCDSRGRVLKFQLPRRSRPTGGGLWFQPPPPQQQQQQFVRAMAMAAGFAVLLHGCCSSSCCCC